MKKMIHDHYHWVIAAAVFLHLGIFVGYGNVGGLFVLPVTESLGISRSSYSLAATLLYGLFSCLVQIVSGPAYKRFGYRKMICFGLPLAAVSYLVIAGAQDLTGLLIGYALRGIAFGLCASTNANRVINEWFHRHRGLVWGVLAAVTGLGGSAWCLILPPVIQESGWRSAYVLAAGLVCLVMIINLIFIRNKPTDMGLLPYGEGEHIKKTNISDEHFQGCSFQELVRKPIFYLTMATLFVVFVSVYLPNSVIVAHMCDKGLSDMEAAQLQSILLFALAISKVILGWLIDRIGIRIVTVICCLCAAISMFLLPTVSDYSQALVAVIIYGLGLPMTTIIVPALTIDLFGYHSYVTAVGIFSATISMGSMMAGPLSNISFDNLGSYTLVFRIGAVVMLAMIAVLLVIFRRADKLRKQLEQETV
jgi:MFS family permease